MIHISKCCGKSTFEGMHREYPLGGSTWGINYKVTCCEGCGQECEEVEACDQCGEPGALEHINGDDCCPKCAMEMKRLNAGVSA